MEAKYRITVEAKAETKKDLIEQLELVIANLKKKEEDKSQRTVSNGITGSHWFNLVINCSQ